MFLVVEVFRLSGVLFVFVLLYFCRWSGSPSDGASVATLHMDNMTPTTTSIEQLEQEQQ